MSRNKTQNGNSVTGLGWFYLLLVSILLSLMVASCGDPTATTRAVGNVTTVAVASTTSATNSTTAAATAPAVVPPGSFRNPIFQSDFPDPFVLKVKDIYYAYATNASGRNIQVANSKDLINWELQGDALPALPTWAQLGGSLVWAPEVTTVGDKFALYYTARDKKSNKQCIGVAISDIPDARFKDSNAQPLVCQSDEGGSIDPHPYREGDKLYLFWKNDGNCCSIRTNLYVQELTADGLTFAPGTTATRLVNNDVAWEGRVVEAPTMIKRDGRYYLFFSANDYAGLDYAVGYANCKAVTGPCEDAPENPILKTALQKPPVIGPGHQHVMQIGDETWIFYHAWEVTGGGLKTSRRFMWLDRINWKDGKPVVQGPTLEAQPVPKLKP
jgi:beta-xylosidase